MHFILTELNAELANLRNFVQSIVPVNNVLANYPDSQIRQYLTLRRGYDYAAFVVALYASFERFCEALVSDYARCLSEIIPYSELPEALVKKHFNQAAEMLQKKQLGEGRYAGITQLSVTQTLFKCLSGDDEYNLLPIAIAAHDNNLRKNVLEKLFKDVGIDDILSKACSSDSIVQWYKNIAQVDEVNADRILSIVNSKLEDLVERRNEVAHRGGSTELLGQEEMLELIDLLEAICVALLRFVYAEYVAIKIRKMPYATECILREKPYQSGTVLVIDAPLNHRVYVGQPAFSLLSSTGIRWGKILSIKAEGNDVDSYLETGGGSPIGIMLDISMKGGRAYILTDDVYESSIKDFPPEV